ncbi:MAG TPA: acyl carrier protein [Polyangiaceae bacterium]|nr:acyl carrier protein [Polyangiaceae bacterium]
MLPPPIRVVLVDTISALTGKAGRDISDGDDLVEDLGVDSLIAAKLLVEVEDRLGRQLPDGSEASLAGARTVGELVERFAAAVALDPSETSDGSLGG